jgi:hypothetical protein
MRQFNSVVGSLVPTITMIWCLLIDHDNTPSGSFFEVTAELRSVAHLKDEVKNKKQNKLKNVDADELVVWRCKNRSTALRKDQVVKLFSDAGVEMIDEMTTMVDLGLLDNEQLLVQVPSVFSSSSLWLSHFRNDHAATPSRIDRVVSIGAPDPSLCQREATVSGIWQILEKKHLVLVHSSDVLP